MRIIAFITDLSVARDILAQRGEPIAPPTVAPPAVHHGRRWPTPSAIPPPIRGSAHPSLRVRPAPQLVAIAVTVAAHLCATPGRRVPALANRAISAR